MKYTKSYKKTCEMCGKEFVAHTASQKYCDAWCAHEHDLKVKKENHQRKKKSQKP